MAQTTLTTAQLTTRLLVAEANIKTLQERKTVVIGGTVVTGATTDTLKIPTAVINLRIDSAAKAITGLNSATYTATQTAMKKADTALKEVGTVNTKINSLQSYDAVVKQTLLDYLKAFDDLNNAILIKADESDLNDAKGRLDAIESKLFKMLQALQ